MSDIESRLKRLEEQAGSLRDDELEFYEFCTGTYDPALTLEENLRSAELPPGAVPSTAIVAPQGGRFSAIQDKKELMP